MLKPVAPGENVNAKGDDIALGGVAVPKGTLIEPRHTAVLAALGISELKVRKPLTVGILSTGDELVDYTETPKGTEIRNINSVTLAAAVQALGCIAKTYPIDAGAGVHRQNISHRAGRRGRSASGHRHRPQGM
jgi:molybdopterin molybdotransferase